MSRAAATALRLHRRATALLLEPPPRLDQIAIRPAVRTDAGAIHALIETHRVDGRLLPRGEDEVAVHAERFTVAVCDGRVLACADLAPLGRDVAEVRSLVVDSSARCLGVGRLLVDALRRQAEAAGFSTLCAFTHVPGYFVARGFSIVPHEWLPEKIQADCRTCAQFRHCGQYAVMLPLTAPRSAWVPLSLLGSSAPPAPAARESASRAGGDAGKNDGAVHG
jgi:amino-acid N-acetyltransferase